MTDRKWGVFHDIYGIGCHVVDVKYGEVRPEDLCQVPTVTPVLSDLRGQPKAMRFTRLEATLIAAQLDAQLVANCKAEFGHLENWQDYLGNFGYWYADEFTNA